MVSRGEIVDGKTILLLQYAKLNGLLGGTSVIPAKAGFQGDKRDDGPESPLSRG
jgi:hypothetical protein